MRSCALLMLAKMLPELKRFNFLRAKLFQSAGANLGSNISIAGCPSVGVDSLRNLNIGDSSFINRSVCFGADAKIFIGKNVLISPGVIIETSSHRKNKNRSCYAEPIHICDGVWLGAGSIVLGGVTIGDGAIVGAGSLVNRDVEEFQIVGGVPARVLQNTRSKS